MPVLVLRCRHGAEVLQKQQRSKEKAMITKQELKELLEMIRKAKEATDGDGDWAECYAEDVARLLAELKALGG